MHKWEEQANKERAKYCSIEYSLQKTVYVLREANATYDRVIYIYNVSVINFTLKWHIEVNAITDQFSSVQHISYY